MDAPRAAYILENTVTHARLLPVPSKHAFSYPTLALLLSLDALESHELDLARGWLFGYGGTAWRVTGLRAAAYLLPDTYAPGTGERQEASASSPRSIKEKLREVLMRSGWDAGRLGRVWMLTMPSYMGYEGINPLTVHYCYEAEVEGPERLGWVVLEIHNTFGEKHVHVLRTHENEDAESERPPGYDYQWTFARDFHVSPFNDRLGHYTVAVTAPPPPGDARLATTPPRPRIRIHLHAVPDIDSVQAGAQDQTEHGPPKGPLKLTATQVARRAIPLTSTNLLAELVKRPFALFLSFARILYHAWILHYVKRLDVFPRPDPKPAFPGWDTKGAVYGGVGWQDEGALEAYARRATTRFLTHRVRELSNLRVQLVAADPAVAHAVFDSTPSDTPGEKSGGAKTDTLQEPEELVVYYAAPRFFTTLLAAPSAPHALLVGRVEGLFRVNSEDLFLCVFAGMPPRDGRILSLCQKVRVVLLPERFVRQGAPDGTVPATHPLDLHVGLVLNVLVLYALYTLDVLEKTVFGTLRARFVPGLEPWRRWERAADAVEGN